MAKLTSKERKALPAKDFGLPKSKGYPMPDKAHARLAKSGASRAERVGNISKSTEGKIDAKADRKLGGHSNVRNPSTHMDKLKHC